MSRESIYAKVPAINCQGLCQQSCGPIGMTLGEWQAMGRPRPAEVHGSIVLLPGKHDLTCHLLKDGRCSVYAERPLICRLWGVVESMPCIWGCKPERVLSDKEGNFLLTEMRC